ncbi:MULTISPECIES: hypothetical protein [Methylacidiphilum (ex Ratnadevi et al. 2023)]|jgi:hypothetical protein|uniref:Uncharacterized protein n=1 Tax=Methylacidiphilum kamchatkense Kam1 TaxID=1202785 RepID=A0A516TMB7_9BACT|nr:MULTISPECIES: hypothetical protein [Methylacidiphilum (ex Ratnadevi et al. 2023)]QDQ42388.1 hypothetical protein kam1_1160 [Methylacidiphilum kamchatkense Kam1]
MRGKVGQFLFDAMMTLLIAIAIDRFCPEPLRGWCRNGWQIIGNAMEEVVHWIGRLFH